MVFLYKVRGATNEQLRRYLYGHLQSKRATQLANTSKFVSQLKRDGFLKSNSCHPHRHGEINYLTKKGIEYIHDTCLIDKNDNKMLGFGEQVGSFDYELLKPPLHYLEHHLMFVDLVIDYPSLGQYRHSLYAVKEYKSSISASNRGYNKTHKLRPDAEITFRRDTKTYFCAIEVDTGSERYDQLVNKFSNYKRYFDYCLRNNKKLPYFAILFHTKRSTEEMNLADDKRWITILKAAAVGLEYYCWTVHIVGIRRPSFIKLLNNKQDLLNSLDISIPGQINTVIEEIKQEKERVRMLEEKERKMKQQLENKLQRELRRRELAEQQKEVQIELQYVSKGEEEKKRSILSKLFGK
ncbi:hypothetical protein GN156_03955 [bacterium LRH843]|nr:hypothetical protein [bacterium LRH843]